MNDTSAISKYIVNKITNKLHLSYFAGFPHEETTTFILRDSKHNYNVDVVERFKDAHFHIIDICDVSPRILNDRDSYLMCSGTHYGFHSCVLKLMKSTPITEIGWPCQFVNYMYYAAQNTVPGWWESINFADHIDIVDDDNTDE